MMPRASLARPITLQLILLLVCLLHPVRGAENPTSVCDRDPFTSLAFVGTLTDAKPRDGNANVILLKFRIAEPLLGKTSSEVSMETVNTPDCGIQKITDHIGENYLVQAHNSPEGYIDAWWGCHQIRPASEAHAEIEYFRRLQKGQTPTEILGEARYQERLPLTSFPVPGTRIHLLGEGHEYNFVSDEKGLFRGVVSPGKYKASVDWPKAFAPNRQDLCGPLEFTVAARRCTSVAVCAQAAGSITAHIVDVNGESLASRNDVELTLETAEGKFVKNTFPDEKSNLVIEDLLPGKYILGLIYPNMEGMAPYRPIYFPRVKRRSHAQVITLGAGEHKVLSEMRIKKGVPCRIPVYVIDGAGKPAPAVDIAIEYPELHQFYIYPDQQTNSDGRRAVYVVFPGIVYLRAEKANEEGLTEVESDIVEVGSCPAEPVLLKLSHRITGPQKPQGN